MRFRELFYLIIVLCASQTIIAQNLFDQKYEDCNTDYFTTESDSIKVFPSVDVKSFFKENINEDALKQIEGVLTFQIIVDKNGNSCLLSFENTTNKTNYNLTLKQIIDKKLKWEKPKQKTSIIVALEFSNNSFKVYRIGMSREKGYHFISH